MKQELSIYELGKFLSLVSSKYKTEVLAKINLSGGWMTVQGEIEVIEAPKEIVMPKGNNVITIKFKSDSSNETPMKIIGAKDKKFNISIEPKKVVEIHTGGLGLQMEKKKNNESAIKLDDSIVLTVSASADEVVKML